MSYPDPRTPPTTLPRRPVPVVGANGPRVSLRARKTICLGILALAGPILAFSGGNRSAAEDLDPEPVAAAAAPATSQPAEADELVAEPVAASPDEAAPETTDQAPSSTVTAPTARVTTTTRPTPTTRVTTTSSTTAPSPTTTTAKPKATKAVSSSFLQCVRQRESRGNYQAVNPSSGTGGAYQFHQATWDQTAKTIGRGDLVGTRPERAAPSTQDLLATSLYQQAGTAPWGGGCVAPTDG